MKLFFFPDQKVIRPFSDPIKETGHIQVLYGNLAPEGSVAKITGKEGLYFSGTVFYPTLHNEVILGFLPSVI